MSRRFEGVEARRAAALDEAKAWLKPLGDRERLVLLAWLCIYFDDDGALRPADRINRRKSISVNDVEYWLVRKPRMTSR